MLVHGRMSMSNILIYVSINVDGKIPQNILTLVLGCQNFKLKRFTDESVMVFRQSVINWDTCKTL